MMNDDLSLANFPELAAFRILSDSIDVVAELLDELHPELVLGDEGEPEIQTLMMLLTACNTAIDAYHEMRVDQRLVEEASRQELEDLF